MLYRNENEYYAYADTVEMINDEMCDYDNLRDWFKKNGARFAELDEICVDCSKTPEDIVTEYYKYCDDFEEVLFDFVDASESICHRYHFDKYSRDIIDDYLKDVCEGHPEWMKLIKNIY